MIRIVLDLMGGDRAPEEIKAGAFMYLDSIEKVNKDVKLIVVGIKEALDGFEKYGDLVELVECIDFLSGHDLWKILDKILLFQGIPIHPQIQGKPAHSQRYNAEMILLN
ncbi:MAG: hypothetical protein ACK40U_05595, partial [Fervidobacterium pennivorans]